MNILPPYLKKNDTIGITCPAGWITKEKVAYCANILTQVWGFKVIIGETIGTDSPLYMADTDENRLKEFQEMLDNNEIKAIMCGRGGYGSGRIVDRIDWKIFKKNPKWIIGFSDITMIHNHIQKNCKTVSLHSSMTAAFGEDGYKNEYIQSILKAITGKGKLKYTANIHEYNKKGICAGELVGGNITLLANAIGTKSDINTNNKILVIEEIGEYMYCLDRLLLQMQRAGKFKDLAGLIVGGFADMKETERPFGNTPQQIINEIVAPYDYPVCYEFPVSHNTENYALKMGADFELKVGKNKVNLTEL